MSDFGSCAFCELWDPETLAPIGPTCDAPAVEIVHWKDGRVSPACKDHGFAALTVDARKEVAAISQVKRT